ncbi:MAG TPA: 3-phosphoshikimate 1-carboxyvinyltransferase [Clostridiales bacterium]|nr:3-phosphoshikimate 1-carboxyvinyltransferase [Clostridiales bacterium]
MIARSHKSTLSGHARAPGSKSHTIRAVLMATMSEGTSYIRNPLTSRDAKSSLDAARAFGAKVTVEDGVWIIEGRGKNLQVPENYVECGNSGTVSAFSSLMAGLVDGYTFITGDEQIRRRPIYPSVEAINALGGHAVFTRPGSKACPIVVKGPIKGGKVHFTGLLSQMISGTLMVAPLLPEDTEITVDNPLETPYLQMTLDWIKHHGVEIENPQNFKYFKIKGGQSYRAQDTVIPSDWSGVAFPLVAAVVTQSNVIIDGVDFHDSQGDKAVVDLLISMGADIEKDVEGGRLIIKGGKPLQSGFTFDLQNIPDSLPAMSVAAAYAQGDTKFVGLDAVRLKETDRVAVMQSELGKMGASIEVGADYMIVHGGKPLKGAEVESYDDHRIAMAMTIAGFFAEGETVVKDAECVAVTFPNFFEVMKNIGADVATEE